MLVAAYVIWHISVKAFYNLHNERLSRRDTLRAMEAGAVA